MKVGEAADDESPFGCRDMAGNGKEWTRDLSADDRTVPLTNPQGENVRLRGQSYQVAEPAQYKSLAAGVWPYGDTAPDIGFRVVLEP
jgi:formylglycine-generating enzyme required for sulfatase activity